MIFKVKSVERKLEHVAKNDFLISTWHLLFLLWWWLRLVWISSDRRWWHSVPSKSSKGCRWFCGA